MSCLQGSRRETVQNLLVVKRAIPKCLLFRFHRAFPLFATNLIHQQHKPMEDEIKLSVGAPTPSPSTKPKHKSL